MRITTRGRYALRASLALAKMGKTGALVSINSISAAENLSPIFLEQIFFNLKKAGLVKSVRGPGGGFTFTQPPENLNIREILEAAGEVLTAGFCDKHSTKCDRISGCNSHKVWINLEKLIYEYFQNMTLSSLLEDNELVRDNLSNESSKK